MAARPSMSTAVLAGVGTVLAVLGGAWWVRAAPVTPPPVAVVEEPAGLSPFARIMVVDEETGAIIYDERQPPGPAEKILSSELPCGAWQLDERTFQQRIWAARQASTEESLCWLVRNRK